MMDRRHCLERFNLLLLVGWAWKGAFMIGMGWDGLGWDGMGSVRVVLVIGVVVI